MLNNQEGEMLSLKAFWFLRTSSMQSPLLTPCVIRLARLKVLQSPPKTRHREGGCMFVYGCMWGDWGHPKEGKTP